MVNLTTEPSFDPAKIKPIFNIKTDGIPIEEELISLSDGCAKTMADHEPGT